MKNQMRLVSTTLALALLVTTSAFADDDVAERIIATYGALESYCDTVATKGFQSDVEVRRCYTRDGRYKRIEQETYQRRLEWGDNVLAYTWYTHPQAGTTLYLERPASSATANGLPDGLTARALNPFLREAHNESDVRKILGEMAIVEDTPSTILLQRQRKYGATSPKVIDRLWIRRSDGLVTRGEEVVNGRIAQSATLVEARVNAPLSQADLSETAPFLRRFFHRHNLITQPRAFVSGLAVIAFITGLVTSLVWRRSRNWRSLWRLYAKGGGTAIIGLAALAAISVLPWFRGGHPPAIFLVIVLAGFAALAALVLATLMLGMQLGDAGTGANASASP